jgi:hypothetical protein
MTASVPAPILTGGPDSSGVSLMGLLWVDVKQT